VGHTNTGVKHRVGRAWSQTERWRESNSSLHEKVVQYILKYTIDFHCQMKELSTEIPLPILKISEKLTTITQNDNLFGPRGIGKLQYEGKLCEEKIEKYLKELSIWQNKLGNIPTYGLYTDFFCFSLDPFPKLPHDEGWIWNQTNKKITITLADNTVLTVQKLNARRRKNQPKAPSYKVWQFKHTSEKEPKTLYGIWCEKGFVLPSNSNTIATFKFTEEEINNGKELKLPPVYPPSGYKTYQFHYENGYSSSNSSPDVNINGEVLIPNSYFPNTVTNQSKQANISYNFNPNTIKQDEKTKLYNKIN